MPTKIKDQTGFFINGGDSLHDPSFLKPTQFVYAYNILHRGGKARCRPGNCEVIAPPVTGEQFDAYNPQGGCHFVAGDGTEYLVMAHAGLVYYSPFPFLAWTQIQGIQFYPFAEQIIFEPRAVQSQITNPDNSITILAAPRPLLIMQDGFTRAAYWDGNMGTHTVAIPIAQTMIWNSLRMWFGDGNKLHAGDFANPLQMTEEAVPATGGFFTTTSGQDITAIAETPDLRALLVMGDSSTDTFQSAVLDRTQWSSTPGFQTQLFRNIGCVGPKAWLNQYGLTWWMSHNGLINLDTAIQTYRTRRIRYSDQAVLRSKAKLHSRLNRICFGQYENLLLISWPSADIYNAHTVVMDQLSYSTTDDSPDIAAWAGPWKGIRPVEWISGVINGENRCIAISRDYSNVNPGQYQIGIWEAMTPQRVDLRLDGTFARIMCGIEMRELAFSQDPKKLTMFEVPVSECRNGIDYTLSFNGNMTGFTEVGNGHIDASQFNPDPTDFNEYRPQQRLLRSEEVMIARANYVSAQKKLQQAVDYGFGFLIQWTGDMAIDGVRMYADPQPDANVGQIPQIENTARLVDWDTNIETITDLAPATPFYYPQKSAPIESLTQRWIEPFYSSRQ